MPNIYRSGLSHVFAVSATPLVNNTSLPTSPEVARTLQSVSRGSTATPNNFIIRGEPGSGGQTIALGGARERTISISGAYAFEDEAITILNTAHESQDDISFYILNGPAVAGAAGWVGNCKVVTLNIEEPEDGVVNFTAELGPTEIFNSAFVVPA